MFRNPGWTWWYLPSIPTQTFGRKMQEDCKFQASLGYMKRSCLKN